MSTGQGAAAELAALVRESLAAGVAREVLHLRVASLSPELRRPHHLRLLRDALAPALAATRSRVFDLPNGDVVAVAPPPAPAFEAAAAALRESLEASTRTEAVRRLRLPGSAAALLSAAVESLGLGAAAATPAGIAVAAPPLGAADLALAERALAGTDLEPLTRTQRVFRLSPAGHAQLLWEDRRIAMPSLARALLNGRDPSAAPALRRRLMRAAEERLLAGLTRPAAFRDWRPAGLTLSLATLEGPAFARFEAALPAGRREQVVIGIAAGEILGDAHGYLRIRDRLSRRGLRLALDDVEAETLALLPFATLGLDVLRLAWSPRLPATALTGLADLLAGPDGADRVVLTGADRAAALAWGWETGISMFQGPVVDR